MSCAGRFGATCPDQPYRREAKACQIGHAQSLDESRGKYRRAVGIEPYNLRTPGRLGGMPSSKDEPPTPHSISIR
jgi:hypothetical protein